MKKSIFLVVIMTVALLSGISFSDSLVDSDLVIIAGFENTATIDYRDVGVSSIEITMETDEYNISSTSTIRRYDFNGHVIACRVDTIVEYRDGTMTREVLDYKGEGKTITRHYTGSFGAWTLVSTEVTRLFEPLRDLTLISLLSSTPSYKQGESYLAQIPINIDSHLDTSVEGSMEVSIRELASGVPSGIAIQKDSFEFSVSAELTTAEVREAL